MVKRKYIEKQLRLSFALFISLLLYSNFSLAEAWIPKKDTYNYRITLATIDRSSRKNKEKRIKIFIQLQDKIDKLYSEIFKIQDRANKENRQLTNTEIRTIEQIKQDIEISDEASSVISAFKDENFTHLSMEYGATAKSSIGISMGYIVDRFASNDGLCQDKIFIGKHVDLFYKYQIFENNRWSISIKPMIECSSEKNSNLYKFVDIAIFAGNSKQNKKGTIIFHELGLSLRKYSKHTIDDRFGYVASIMDGITTKNGWTLTNFVQYERSRLKNLIYNNILYEQISAAKEFKLNSYIKNIFTLQIGYFWKISLTYKDFMVSGPILSISSNL
jgi:hypothetical protein